MLKIQRPSNKNLSSSRSSGSKIQTGTGNHQLQKKNSAASVLEKQLNEARQQAEEDAAEKVKREAEKMLQEKKKVSHALVVTLSKLVFVYRYD